MDEHLPFLRAICANPADDLPRLVYADYLEESGEPDAVARAHFIRAQIALTQLTPASKEFREMLAVTNRLSGMYSQDWLWDLPEELHAHGKPQWRRGFIESVKMPWETFVGESLFDTVPLTRVRIDSVRFDHGTTVEALEALPHVRRITHLSLGPHLHDDGDSLLFLLLDARNFAGLTHLDFSENDFENLASFILRFGEAAFAPTLETLNLSDVEAVDDAIGNALATARGMESISRIDLRKTEMSGGVRAMLRRRFGDRVAF